MVDGDEWMTSERMDGLLDGKIGGQWGLDDG